MRLRAAAALILSLLAAPATAAPTVIDDPFGVRFTPPQVDLVGVGYRTAAGTDRATKVTERHADGTLVLATESGATITARLEEVTPGVTRLTLTAPGARFVSASFAAAAGERYLGFGERSNAVDQRGGVVENYVGEGAYEEDERTLIAPFVAQASYHPRDDATYFPMPWLLSTRGYGVLLEGSRVSTFDLSGDEKWTAEAEGNGLSLLVIAGPRPAGVLRRLTEQTGRQPRPAAPWFFGPWFQTGQENAPPPDTELGYVHTLREHDAPVSVAETHMRYLPCGAHLAVREAERARVAALHAQGLATLTYMRDVLCTEYARFDEASARGLLLRNAAGEDYVFTGYDGGRTPPIASFGAPDFSADGVTAFYGELVGEALEDGHDGWMEDFGEAVPLDARAANGMTGAEMHNLYPVLYHRAGYAAARAQDRPVARFIRSGWTGVHPSAQIVWGGDPTVDWGFDGLSSVVTNALTMGLSGISTWGSDIGGYHALLENRLTPELLKRWIELGSLTPVMRTKAAGVQIPASTRPQIWEPEILPTWRRWAKWHTQLNPYLRGADATYRRTGMPIVRHLALAWPDDARAAGTDDEFLFGPDLLVAPVLAPGQHVRRAYLPRGRWIDLWRSARYAAKSGGLRLRRATALRGARDVAVPAPLSEIPVFVRAGALLPLLPPDVDTLAPYRGAGAVRAADRSGRMELLAWPVAGRRVAHFGAGERILSVVRGRHWTLRFHAARARVYAVQAALPCGRVLRRTVRAGARAVVRLPAC